MSDQSPGFHLDEPGKGGIQRGHWDLSESTAVLPAPTVLAALTQPHRDSIRLWQTALLSLHGLPAPGTQQAASFLQVHLCRHQGQQPPMQHSQGKGEAAGRLVRWAESREGGNAIPVAPSATSTEAWSSLPRIPSCTHLTTQPQTTTQKCHVMTTLLIATTHTFSVLRYHSHRKTAERVKKNTTTREGNEKEALWEDKNTSCHHWSSIGTHEQLTPHNTAMRRGSLQALGHSHSSIKAGPVPRSLTPFS